MIYGIWFSRHICRILYFVSPLTSSAASFIDIIVIFCWISSFICLILLFISICISGSNTKAHGQDTWKTACDESYQKVKHISYLRLLCIFRLPKKSLIACLYYLFCCYLCMKHSLFVQFLLQMTVTPDEVSAQMQSQHFFLFLSSFCNNWLLLFIFISFIISFLS